MNSCDTAKAIFGAELFYLSMRANGETDKFATIGAFLPSAAQCENQNADEKRHISALHDCLQTFKGKTTSCATLLYSYHSKYCAFESNEPRTFDARNESGVRKQDWSEEKQSKNH